MLEILKTKADQCPKFKNRLLNTGSAELVEDTSDKYWARGLRNDGENMMGTLLMLLRQKLKKRKGRRPTQQNKWVRDTRRRNNFERRCSHCGENNHTTENCRFDRPLQCHQCHYEGHKQKFCHLGRNY